MFTFDFHSISYSSTHETKTTGAENWSRLMALVSGACVMGLKKRFESSAITSDLLVSTMQPMCFVFSVLSDCCSDFYNYSLYYYRPTFTASENLSHAHLLGPN